MSVDWLPSSVGVGVGEEVGVGEGVGEMIRVSIGAGLGVEVAVGAGLTVGVGAVATTGASRISKILFSDWQASGISPPRIRRPGSSVAKTVSTSSGRVPWSRRVATNANTWSALAVASAGELQGAPDRTPPATGVGAGASVVTAVGTSVAVAVGAAVAVAAIGAWMVA